MGAMHFLSRSKDAPAAEMSHPSDSLIVHLNANLKCEKRRRRWLKLADYQTIAEFLLCQIPNFRPSDAQVRRFLELHLGEIQAGVMRKALNKLVDISQVIAVEYCANRPIRRALMRRVKARSMDDMEVFIRLSKRIVAEKDPCLVHAMCERKWDQALEMIDGGQGLDYCEIDYYVPRSYRHRSLLGLALAFNCSAEFGRALLQARPKLPLIDDPIASAYSLLDIELLRLVVRGGAAVSAYTFHKFGLERFSVEAVRDMLQSGSIDISKNEFDILLAFVHIAVLHRPPVMELMPAYLGITGLLLQYGYQPREKHTGYQYAPNEPPTRDCFEHAKAFMDRHCDQSYALGHEAGLRKRRTVVIKTIISLVRTCELLQVLCSPIKIRRLRAKTRVYYLPSDLLQVLRLYL